MMVRDGAAGAGSGGRVPRSVSTLSTLSRNDRREALRGRAEFEFGSMAEAALDLMELLGLAWHDTHGDLAPPEQVVDDLWLLARGDLGRLVLGARLAVTDWRDLRIAADRARGTH